MYRNHTFNIVYIKNDVYPDICNVNTDAINIPFPLLNMLFQKVQLKANAFFWRSDSFMYFDLGGSHIRMANQRRIGIAITNHTK